MRVFKFNVKILVERVTLSINFPGKLLIQIKRGNQKLETNPSELNVGVATFNQQLELETNIYTKEQQFQEKKCSFTVVIVTQKGNKVGGLVGIDLATYLKKNQLNISETLNLEKCPDRHAKLYVKIQFTLIKEIDPDELSRISMVSNTNNGDEDINENQENRESNEMRQQLQNQMIKVQQKDNEISLHKNELQDKQELINELTRTNGELKQQLYETLDKLQEKEDNGEKLKNELQIERQKYKKLEQKQIEMEQQIIYLKEQEIKLNNELRKADLKYNQMIKQKDELLQQQQEIDQSQEIQNQEQEHQKEIYIYKNKIKQLEDQLKKEQSKSESEYALYQVKLTNLQTQLIDRGEQLNKIRRQDMDDSHNKKLQELQKQIDLQSNKEEQFNKILNQYKEQLSTQIRNEKKFKQIHQQQIDQLSEEIIKLKCQIGEMFNAAQDYGGSKLVDKLQLAVGLG